MIIGGCPVWVTLCVTCPIGHNPDNMDAYLWSWRYNEDCNPNMSAQEIESQIVQNLTDKDYIMQICANILFPPCEEERYLYIHIYSFICVEKHIIESEGKEWHYTLPCNLGGIPIGCYEHWKICWNHDGTYETTLYQTIMVGNIEECDCEEPCYDEPLDPPVGGKSRCFLTHTPCNP